MDKNKIIAISGIAGSGKDTLAQMLLAELPDNYITYSFAYPLKKFSQKMFGFNYADVFTQEGKEASFVRYFNKETFRKNFDTNIIEILSSLANNIGSNEDITQERLDELFLRFLEVLSDQVVQRTAFEAIKGWWSPEKAVIGFESTPRIILQLLGTEFFRDSISNDFWTDIAPKTNAVIPDMRFLNELDFAEANSGITVGIVGRTEGTTSSAGHSSENVGPVIERCKYVVENTGTLDDLRAKARDIIRSEFQ